MSAQFRCSGSAPQVDLSTDRSNNRGSAVSWWQRISLAQYSSLIYKGFRTLISEKDLLPLEVELTSSYCLETFEGKWLKEQKLRSRRRGFEAVPTEDTFPKPPYAPTTKATPKNTIWLALVSSFWPFIVKAICLELLLISSRLLNPLLLGALIEQASSSGPVEVAFGYCVALFAASLVSGCALEHVLHGNYVGALQIRGALMSAVYQKSLSISTDAQRAFPLGQLMSMMSVDVENVYKFVERWTLMWSWLLRLSGSLILLWMQLGLESTLAGVVVMLAQIPLTAAISRRISSIQNQHMSEKGTRLSLLMELLNGIKTIKLYAWETAFAKRIGASRLREVEYVKKFLLHQAILALIWHGTPVLIAAVSLGCFVLIDDDNILTPKRAFVSISLFASMRFSLAYIPRMIASFARCKVSLRGIQNFLQAGELDLDEASDEVREGEVIEFRKTSFAWDSAVVLDNIDLSIREGELIAIIGPVGSGKSSLVESILGSLKKVTGQLHRKKVPMAYVPQEAWILDDSVRGNIVFTSTPDDAWYRTVIGKCCLLPDLDALEHSDETRIGKKGVTLSGGQKQLVSLARAVFRKADLYLLDDPLSAVDPRVLQDLLRDVIGPRGLLKATTRILVTHSQAVLPFCDRVVVLKAGKVDFVGTYDDLIRTDVSIESVLGRPDEETERAAQSQVPAAPEATSTAGRAEAVQDDEEEVVVGNVSWRLYAMMLRRFGLLYAVLCLTGYAVYEISKVVCLFWLRRWSRDAKKFDDDLLSAINDEMHVELKDLRESSTLPARVIEGTLRVAQEWSAPSAQPIDRVNTFLLIGSLEIGGIVFGCFFLALGVLSASKRLHNSALNALLRAPLQFFDRTPSGRIVNRLSRDVDVVDLELYAHLDGWLSCLGALVGGLLVIASEVPMMFLVITPCALIFLILLKIYLRNSRQLQRLASVKRSPVLGHFSESLTGASSIRAFQAEAKLSEIFFNRLDVSQNCIRHSNASATWISLRTALICDMILFCLTVVIVLHRDSFDEALSGLLITSSIATIDEFHWVFRFSSWVEKTVIAAERLDQYAGVKSEGPWMVDGVVDALWPMRGSLRFREYTTSYRPSQKPVLRGINLEIAAGETIGVVGRTGAGKSSLAMAVFRVLEATSGSISIDNVNIAEVGLQDLRKRFTIIPQEPVLFRGTLRENLDPQGTHSDEDLLSAIEKAHLDKAQFNLGMSISDGGGNISAGQRQLVSLARALLRQSKIIILDEATAAVDPSTDNLIQETIRADFKHSTLITIAHRLNTVLNYDRIIVLSSGEVVEQGSPVKLLQLKNSVLHSMAKDAGIL